MKKQLVFSFLLITNVFFAQQKKWSLQECVSYALQNNISVNQSVLDVENATLNKKDAIGNFLPSLNASVSQRWSRGLNQDPVTFSAVNATTSNLNAGISSSVDIYNGLKNLHQLRRAKLEILANQYQLDNIKDNISLSIANAFLQILFSKEQLKVLQAQQTLTLQEKQRTNDLIEAGVLPRGDLLEMEATLATQQQQIVNAQNAILLSKISLAQLLLIEDYKNFDIVDNDYQVPLTNILEQAPETILEKAKQTRFDIKIAENNKEIAQQNLKIARAALQPSLTGSYSFGSNYFTSPLFDSPSFSNQFSDNKSHNISLNLNIPIFNGFSIKNNVARSKISVERTQLQLKQASLDLETNVYQAYNDAKGAYQAYQAALKTEQARDQAFNFTKERYNVGLVNAFDFNQSKNRLEAAQSEVIRTKYDYIFKLKVLEFYFGIPISETNP